MNHYGRVLYETVAECRQYFDNISEKYIILRSRFFRLSQLPVLVRLRPPPYFQTNPTLFIFVKFVLKKL